MEPESGQSDGSGSSQISRLRAAPAPKPCCLVTVSASCHSLLQQAQLTSAGTAYFIRHSFHRISHADFPCHCFTKLSQLHSGRDDLSILPVLGFGWSTRVHVWVCGPPSWPHQTERSSLLWYPGNSREKRDRPESGIPGNQTKH